MSFDRLLDLAKSRGQKYDCFVLENSGPCSSLLIPQAPATDLTVLLTRFAGVAEPKNIRDLFGDASARNDPLLDQIFLGTMVTVVDSHAFMAE